MKKILKLSKAINHYQLLLDKSSFDFVNPGYLNLIFDFVPNPSEYPTQIRIIDPLYDEDLSKGCICDFPGEVSRCLILKTILEKSRTVAIISFDALLFQDDPHNNQETNTISDSKPWFGIPSYKQGLLYLLGIVDVDTATISFDIWNDEEYLAGTDTPTVWGDGLYAVMVGRLYRLGRCIVIYLD